MTECALTPFNVRPIYGQSPDTPMVTRADTCRTVRDTGCSTGASSDPQ